jgi:hypothetical protein
MAVVSLAERCTNLKTLALLCGDTVNHAVVEAFALSCTRLEGLQLWGTFGSASLSAVATHGGFRLRFLTLRMERCDLQCLYHIAEHCRMQLCSCRFENTSGSLVPCRALLVSIYLTFLSDVVSAHNVLSRLGKSVAA